MSRILDAGDAGCGVTNSLGLRHGYVGHGFVGRGHGYVGALVVFSVCAAGIVRLGFSLWFTGPARTILCLVLGLGLHQRRECLLSGVKRTFESCPLYVCL